MKKRKNKSKIITLLPLFSVLLIIVLVGCTRKRVPGDVKDFKPIESIPKVAEYVGEGSILKTIIAYHVEQNGQMNLKVDYNPSVMYESYARVEYEFINFYDKTNKTYEKHLVEIEGSHKGSSAFSSFSGAGHSSSSGHKRTRGGMRKSMSIGKIKDNSFANININTVMPVSIETIWKNTIDAGFPTSYFELMKLLNKPQQEIDSEKERYKIFNLSEGWAGTIKYNFWEKKIDLYIYGSGARKTNDLDKPDFIFNWDGEIIQKPWYLN